MKILLEELNKTAGSMRYWSAVRYSSSLLHQMIDSISPYVTQILASGRNVGVGTPGLSSIQFDKPLTPAEIQDALYTKVQPHSIISAVLQQELILYSGKLIAAHPDLFSGILVVRIGWLLRALELYQDMTMSKPEPIHTCSPHTLRKLVHTVLSESSAIDLDESSKHQNKSKLSVHDVRQLSGCLLRTPKNFYVKMWHLLSKVSGEFSRVKNTRPSPTTDHLLSGGIRIHGQHMPQQPTINDMASTEMRFAYAFELMLNGYDDPIYKEMAVEFLTVLSKILKRHPEISFIDCIDVDDMIHQAIKLYAEDYDLKEQEAAKEKFVRDDVAHTSVYLGKAIIVNLLDAKSLSLFATNASASQFQCKVQ